MFCEYVLGVDGGTGHEEQAYRDKAVMAMMVEKINRFIWPLKVVE
ncbi:MAG TPA: hypothetical protein PLR60_11790 [Syntrophorhabdaceae bacterium]|nr:hypothetical protein [Syntrophorhabdaceae bacterium]